MKEDKTQENIVNEEDQNEKEVIETVELTILQPKTGTLITCRDPYGYDQSPVPEIVSGSENYSIDTVCVNGALRPEAYYKTYNTLVYYSDVRIQSGKTYTVFGKVKAAPGYMFNDPVDLFVNGEELSPEVVEDYSLESDSFTFYYDLKIA